MRRLQQQQIPGLAAAGKGAERHCELLCGEAFQTVLVLPVRDHSNIVESGKIAINPHHFRISAIQLNC